MKKKLVFISAILLLVFGGIWYDIYSQKDGKNIESAATIQNAHIVHTIEIEDADRVAIAGNALFVAANARLSMYDLANPAKPTPIKTWGIDDARLDAFSGDGQVLYGYDGDGFFRIDASNINNPQYIRPETNDRPDVHDWVVHDGIIYSANNGLETYRGDTIPETPFVGYGESEYSLKVARSGQHAFVLDVYEGLVSFNVENPEYPIRVGSLNNPAYKDTTFDLALNGSHAFVTLEKSGLKIIDISNPSQPKEFGSLTEGLNAQAIASTEHYVFIADGTNGLKIVDVRKPDAPKVLSTVDTPGEAVDVVVYGRFAYVADNDGGVSVVELGPDPLQSPKEIQTSCQQEYRGYVYNDYKKSCGLVTIHACVDPELTAQEADCTTNIKKSPVVPSADTDQDGLTDVQEVLYGTNATMADTDSDSYNDIGEIQNLYNPLGPGSMKVELFSTYCRQYLMNGSPTGSYGANPVSAEEQKKICGVYEKLWANGEPPISYLRSDSGYRLFTPNGVCESAYNNLSDESARSKELACNNIGSDIMLNFFNPQLAKASNQANISIGL